MGRGAGSSDRQGGRGGQGICRAPAESLIESGRFVFDVTAEPLSDVEVCFRGGKRTTFAHSEVFPFLEPRNAPNVQVVVRWVMSNRAIQFLNDWVNEHVKPIPYPAHLAEARRLAKECVADAKKQGISKKGTGRGLRPGFSERAKGRAGHSR